jgi:peptidyl-tRNA hydrolase
MDLAAHHLRSDMFQASPSGEVTVIGVGPSRRIEVEQGASALPE